MSEAEKTDDKGEQELIPVGPGVEEAEEKVAAAPDTEEEEKEEEKEEDTRLGSAEEEEHPRRKETAKERRQRKNEQRRREQAELNYYRQRNEELEKQHVLRIQQLESRQDQLSNAAIDQRIAKIGEQLVLADNVSFEALKTGTREDYQKAQSIRDELNGELVRLNYAKQAATQQQQQQQQQSQQQVQQPQVNSEVVFYARKWAKDHPWYNPNGNDEETQIIRAVDDAVASEGYDPTTDEYWQELTKRVKRRLPERFSANGANRVDENDEDEEEEERPVRASGPKFSSGGRERPLRKGEVYISAERKKAMQLAGLWEDPKARQRMLKRYAQIDAEMAASRH